MAKSALSRARMKLAAVGRSGGSSEAMSRLPPVSGRKAATSIHRNGVVQTRATAQSRATAPIRALRPAIGRDLSAMAGPAALEPLQPGERQRQQDGDADHRRRRRLAGVVELVGVLI